MNPQIEYKVPSAVRKRMRGKDRRLLVRAWRMWRPPLKLTISQWADEYRRLPQGVTSEPGRYSSDRLPWCRFIMDTIGARTYRDNVLVGASQVMAKALDVETPIPTPNGWTTMGALQKGDLVFSEIGKPAKVTLVTEFMHDRPCYSVGFSDGSNIIADADHNWSVMDRVDNRAEYVGRVMTTKEILESGIIQKTGGKRFSIPNCKPAIYPEQSLEVAPYVLGVWLGDGHSYSTNITIHEGDIQICEEVKSLGYSYEIKEREPSGVLTVRLGLDRPSHVCRRGHDKSVTGHTKRGHCAECGRIQARCYAQGVARTDAVNLKLRSLGERLIGMGVKGVGNEKEIPRKYLTASVEQRMDLLRGLMDTDGTCDKLGRSSFTTTSKKLADGFHELIHSLGFKCRMTIKKPFCKYKGVRVYGAESYYFNFSAYSHTRIFKLDRKFNRQPTKRGQLRPEVSGSRAIASITPVASRPVKCIQVDSPSRLYLAGREFIPTHNTEMMNNIVGYYIHADPSPILVKYPTKDSGEAWSKFKFTPMAEATPVLAAIIGDAKSRDGGNTILDKKFAGGGLTVIGANSPSGLRQRSKRVIIQDEIDSDEGSAGEEGDPTLLADKRAESYRNAVKVKASTPTIKGHSRCWKILENSTFHEWHAECPHCKGFHVLSMANLHWPKTKDENGKDVHDLRETYYQCPDCSEKWDDLDRQRAIMAGKPIARHPTATTFGFHIGGLYKLIGGKEQFSSMLEEFSFNFIEAKRGGRETLKVWTNTFAAECFDEDFEKLDEKAVIARAEDYEPTVMIPAGVLRVEGAADVQQDRIECEMVGMGEGEESWGLGYAIFHGDTSKPGGPWDDLDKFIAKLFKHPSGKILDCTSFFVDSGNQQDRVLQFTGPRRSRGVFASKGKNTIGKQDPIMPRKPSINNKRKVHQWMVGVTAAKTVLYTRIMLPVPGVGSMHFPKGHGYDARYFRQLTSEKRMLRYAHGKPYYIFEANERRNEPLDIRVYALAAHRRVFFDPVKLKAEMGVIESVAVVDSPDEQAQDSPDKVGPKAGGMEFERAPVQPPAIAHAARGSSMQLPAYVPMHLRGKR